MTTRANPTVLILLAVQALGFAPSLSAEERRPLGPALTEVQLPKYKGSKLAGQALRDCFYLDVKIRSIEEEWLKLKRPHEVAKSAHEFLGEVLDRNRSALDNIDPEAVASYNRRVDEHGAAVAVYNSLLPKYNEVVERQNSAVVTFNDTCAERAYDKKAWRKIEMEARKAATPKSGQ